MTRSFAFHTLDVFTDRRFAGNQLAVVEDADGLSSDEMQAVAREFNLSETVFLLAPRDPVNTARARIFTPRAELPFAGHPTVGAAILIAQRRAPELLARHDVVVVIEEAIGVLRCEVMRSKSGVAYAQFALPGLPRRLGPAPPRAALAQALSLDEQDIGFGAHEPTRFAAGPSFLFAPLRSQDALSRARRGACFAEIVGAADGAYLYALGEAHEATAIEARMFANGHGIDEDPATGSAAAAFAGVAMAYERPHDGEHEIFISQGRAMGRPSRITLRMSVAESALEAVAIGGQAVIVSEGRLTL